MMNLPRFSTAKLVALLCLCGAIAPAASTRQSSSPATTAAYADRFVTVNGLRIHYLDWGANGKQPLIMIHGISSVAHIYDHIAPQFNRDYHVIAVEMRGHGDSGWSPEGAYVVEDNVRDLEGLVDQLGLKNMVLLGHSTGGRVVQWYAGLHPDRVARLVVEDVGPERPDDIAAGFARTVKAQENGWASEDELLASILKGDNTRADAAIQRTYVHFGTKRREDGRVIWKRDPNLVKGFVPTELWQWVRKIKCPTIYILGSLSNIVPPKTQEELKAALPDVQIVIIDGVGHTPHVEKPDVFIKTVKTFLARAPR